MGYELPKQIVHFALLGDLNFKNAKPTRSQYIMQNLLELPIATTQRPPKGMLLHCGAELVTRQQLAEVPTPSSTDTWYPLPHTTVLRAVEDQLEACGFIISETAHALSHDGDCYFGVLNITVQGRNNDEFSWIVGVRNSHNKLFPAGLVAGSRVFVCDNCAFSGEVRISRKHTRWAERDLHHLTARAVGQLGDKLVNLDHRIQRYQSTYLSNARAHDMVIRSLDVGVITSTQVVDVLKEWREPSHDAFLPRTAWSLFNAFTEVHKTINPHTMIRRSEALHGLFDTETGAAVATLGLN